MLVALIVLFVWVRTRIHFDFHVFAAQMAQADWSKIALGAACIYSTFVFRAVRWSRLVRHTKKVPPFSLLGTQVIGFTAVALIGRVADPVRPYLVSRKTDLTVELADRRLYRGALVGRGFDGADFFYRHDLGSGEIRF